jgi:hypothetical protein
MKEQLMTKSKSNFKCDKRTFKTHKLAYLDIVNRVSKIYFRQYYCSICNGYHNTSKKPKFEKKYSTKINPSIQVYNRNKFKLSVSSNRVHLNILKINRRKTKRKFCPPLNNFISKSSIEQSNDEWD